MEVMDIDSAGTYIGISPEEFGVFVTSARKEKAMPERREIVEALERLLADSYVVYLKTHGYHWNVTGPMFTTLHTLFEQEYTELARAVDEIAERIRALGAPAPGSYAQLLDRSSVKEAAAVPEAMQMVRDLAADQDSIVAAARKVVEAAESAGDVASADLAVQRIRAHEKQAWMLRSHLE